MIHMSWCLTICAIMFLIGLMLGLYKATTTLRWQAIETNHAHYDAKTGDFTWNFRCHEEQEAKR